MTPEIVNKNKGEYIISSIHDLRKPTKTNSLKFLRSKGLSVGTVIDVGVQHKTEELIEVFPDLKHILFEPLEEYHRQIEQAYRSIDYELIKAAVSNENGTAILNIGSLVGDTSRITHSSIVENNTSTPSRNVNKVTLDSFFNDKKYAEPYLLKIDVDGHEIPILEGASKTLEKVSCVVIEAPLGKLAERLNFLMSKGFVLWDIIDMCYYHGNLSQVDLVFLKQTEQQKKNFNPWYNFKFKWSEWDVLNTRL
jgi:FkbM family methyltransferase